MRRMTTALIAAFIVVSGTLGSAHAAQLQWWSHWAVEDSKKAVLFEAKRRFEAKHPGHTVEITFYEKKNMWPALRAAFTAGSGFPDVFYYDNDVPEFMAAGWLADLSQGIRWENIEPYGKAFWTRPGPGGKVGTWAIPVEAASDKIYFNKKLFRDLGIAVPTNFTFTQDQFKDVVTKCTKGGYAAFATGAADREWAALYLPDMLLLSKLGYADVQKLYQGELSLKDPRVVDVFRYYKELIDLGAYAKTLTSMTLAEAHRYFHTEQKACMFPVGSWHGARLRPAGEGRTAPGVRARAPQLPLDEGRQGPQREDAGVAGHSRSRPRAPTCPWRSRSPTPSPTSRWATCGWQRPGSRRGSRRSRGGSTAPSSGTSTSRQGEQTPGGSIYAQQ